MLCIAHGAVGGPAGRGQHGVQRIRGTVVSGPWGLLPEKANRNKPIDVMRLPQVMAVPAVGAAS